MKKIDAIISFAIGFLIGGFFFFVLRAIKIEIPYGWRLLIICPLLSLLGMGLSSRLRKKYPAILQLTRFLLVGALNTLVDLGWLYLFIWVSGIATGPLYPVFKSISFLLTTVHSYFWHKYWTFGEVETGPNSKEFSRFLIIVAIGLGLNIAIASLVVNVIGPQFRLSEIAWAGCGALIASTLTWLWNFWTTKFLVFKKNEFKAKCE